MHGAVEFWSGSVGQDVSAGLTGDSATQIFSRRDDRGLFSSIYPPSFYVSGFDASSFAKEAQDRFDFWTHTAGREVSGSARWRREIGDVDLMESALGGLLVVEVDEVGIGGDDKEIDAEMHRE